MSDNAKRLDKAFTAVCSVAGTLALALIVRRKITKGEVTEVLEQLEIARSALQPLLVRRDRSS